MALHSRGLPFEVPKYSLTGDILAFQTCGLQYRYYNGSALPPSRPVQMWTGEFVHGVMEEAYRQWALRQLEFPWPVTVTPWRNDPPPIPSSEDLANRPDHDIGVLGDLVEEKLRATGKEPRSRQARRFAYDRVSSAVNVLGPDLFPLITTAEERISGTRAMPHVNPIGSVAPRGDRYELTGVADVISNVSVENNRNNTLLRLIDDAIAGLQPPFDLIVDYKAGRRPSIMPNGLWNHHEWQIQTYAWLRSQVPGANRVGAGILVYVSELSPSKTDMVDLMDDIRHGRTDVVPENGSADFYAIYNWNPDAGPPPELTQAFRLQRALRVVDVSPPRLTQAVDQIDQAVAQIEQSALAEHVTGDIRMNWATTGRERDCVACDFKHFCPSPHNRRNQRNPGPPPIPTAPG